MKQIVRTIGTLVVIVFMAACGTTDKEEKGVAKKDSTAHQEHEVAEMNKPVKSTIAVRDDKLNAILQHYVTLTTALVNGDPASARVASNAIEAGAKELNGGAVIATTAAKITASPDIESQRAAYATLSNTYIELIKKSGLISGKLYVDYCPMAMNDKGAYWLSTGEEIRNPYFGQEMLTCGEVKDSID